MKADELAAHQLRALVLSRESLKNASASLQLARETAAMAGTTPYTLDLFAQLIDNVARMQNHMSWH